MLQPNQTGIAMAAENGRMVGSGNIGRCADLLMSPRITQMTPCQLGGARALSIGPGDCARIL